jgi:hypothetical protein
MPRTGKKKQDSKTISEQQMSARRKPYSSRIRLGFVSAGFFRPTNGHHKNKVFFAQRNNGSISVFPVRKDGLVVPRKATGFSSQTMIDMLDAKKLGVTLGEIRWAEEPSSL